MTIDARAVRDRSRMLLQKSGFRFVPTLPLLDVQAPPVRAREEIVKRLAALEAVCVYVTAPPDRYPDAPLREMIKTHGLTPLLTPEELEILDMPRAQANAEHAGMIGWRMENMVPLAWALGNEAPLRCDGAMIDGPDLGHLLARFAPMDTAACARMLQSSTLRAPEEIVGMADLFYCAHNAVRSAQFGGPEGADCVPEGFDPIGNGGVIHERRHALTWMISPGVAWDDTDLST